MALRRLPAGRGFRERGSEPVEATLVMIPLLLMTFLMLDMSMVIFLRTTMQEAVREGARYAITGQTVSGQCQDDTIKAVVKQYALGFLNPAPAAATIHVQFVNANAGGQGTNTYGNIVNVKIEGYKFTPFAPFERLNFPVYVFAQSSDLMEPPSGAAPCLTNPTDQ